MDWNLLITQLMNGLQMGLLLFLLASGLTLIFGIMDFINLSHGSFYMIGAYFCGTIVAVSGSFIAGILLGLIGVFAVGAVLTYLTFMKIRDDRLRDVAIRFDHQVTEMAASVQTNFDLPFEVLYSIPRYFAASEYVSRSEVSPTGC